MNTPVPEKTWLSAFLLVFGILCVLGTAVAIFSGAILIGLVSIAVAVAFLALRHIVDHNQEIERRLRHIEMKLGIGGEDI